jgi:hypothetical protein
MAPAQSPQSLTNGSRTFIPVVGKAGRCSTRGVEMQKVRLMADFLHLKCTQHLLSANAL